MICGECKSKMLSNYSDYSMESKLIGNVLIPKIKFHICPNIHCGNTSIDYKNLDKALKFLENEEHKVIRTLPIGDFISAQQAAKILAVSKQYFSKLINKKKRLFVISKIDTRSYFLKDSILQFQKTGDGRIRINSYNSKAKHGKIHTQPREAQIRKP